MNSNYKLKKESELRALRLAYPEADFPNVISSERPDFIITNDEATFGVEVTEYYQHESSARYEKEEYHELATSTGVVHPRDREVVSLVNFVFPDEDGTFYGYGPPLLMKNTFTQEERLKRLANLISEKGKKFANYDQTLNFINLLIVDKGDLFAGSRSTRKKLENDLASLQSRNPLNLQTPFRNIFICTLSHGDKSVIHLWNNDKQRAD